jgi:hypothetical protein
MSFAITPERMTFLARAIRSTPDLSVRLWKRVRWDEGCWVWEGATTRGGYDVVSVAGRSVLTHRLSFELHRGEIPKGLFLDHLCRRTQCINPRHLDPVTHAENVRRGRAGHNTRAKQECPQGHVYDDENTYITPQGYRACRECARRRNRLHKQEKRRNG